MKYIKINKNIAYYILLQHSNNDIRDKKMHNMEGHIRKFIPDIKKYRNMFESKFNHKPLQLKYNNSIQQEYIKIKKHIPQNLKIIMDLGCGVGGINILINEDYEKVFFLMVDKNEVSKNLKYGWGSTKEFYNNFNVGNEFLILNGIPKDSILFLSPGNNNKIPAIEYYNKVDMIFSFSSCGFHYPIDTYLSQINNMLKVGGIGIFDIRENTNGMVKLKETFNNVEIIEYCEKSFKVKIIKE